MLRVVCRFSSPACTLLSNSRWRPMSCSRDAAGESGREKYSPLWCVKRVLMSIAKAFVDQGMIPDRSNLAKGGMDCCAAASEGCLQNYMAVPGASRILGQPAPMYSTAFQQFQPLVAAILTCAHHPAQACIGCATRVRTKRWK